MLAVMVLVAGLLLVAAPTRRLGADKLVREARRARETQELDLAVRHYRQARWLRPGNGSLEALEIGLIELGRGDLHAAESWLAEVDPAEPDEYRLRLGEARLAAARGRAREALDLTSRLLEAVDEAGETERNRSSSPAQGPRERSLRRGELLVLQASILHGLEGRFEEARRRLRSALEIAGHAPEDHAAVLLRARAQLEMARLERTARSGRGDLGERHLGSALDLFEQHGESRLQAETLALMGLLALSEGDYGRHAELQKRARELFRQAGSLDGPARVEIYLGAMDVGLERHAEARQRYVFARQRLESLGQTLPLRSLARLEADLALRLGRHLEARRRLEALLSAPSSPPERRRVLLLLGHALLHGGEPAAAAERYSEALELDQAHGFEDPAFRARAFAMIGVAATEAGEPQRAESTVHEAIELARRVGDRPGQVVALLAAADLETAKGGDPAAIRRSLEAIDAALDVQDAAAGAAASPFFFSQYWQSVERLRHILLDLEPGPAARRTAQDLMLRLLEQMRSRAFRASSFRAAARRRPTAAEAAAIAELDRRLAEPGDELERAYRRYRWAVLQTELQSERQSESDVSPADLRHALAPGEAAVVYAFGRERVFALLLRRRGVSTIALPLGADELSDRVHLIVERLEKAAAGEATDWRSPARRLHDELLAPLELDGVRRLGVVPLGALHALPWAALLPSSFRQDDDTRGSTPPPPVESYTLVNAPSLAKLLRPPAAGRGEGAVSLGPGRSVEGPELPGALEECREVARWTGGRALCGQRASEAALRGASGARLLHLAAHGVSEPTMPLLSRLSLAPGESADPGPGDGRLTLREILGLELRSDLVVLSSCRATASYGKRAEDWTDADRLGLSGAFLQAGARQVVSSLLPISDEGARALMADFYRELEHHAPAEALARARRRSLARGDVAALGFGVHGALRSSPGIPRDAKQERAEPARQ